MKITILIIINLTHDPFQKEKKKKRSMSERQCLVHAELRLKERRNWFQIHGKEDNV